MALAPADFYAYSRATGVPVPESQEEQAALAPRVIEFRRNQLKAPAEDRSNAFDPLSVGVGVGMALAGGVGLGLGARRLMKGPKKSATAGVRQADLSKMAAEASPVGQVAAVDPSSLRSREETLASLRQQAPTAEVPASRPAPGGPDAVDDVLARFRPEYEKEKRLETGRMTQEEMRRQAARVQEIESEIDQVISNIRQTPSSQEISDPRNETTFSPRSYLEEKGTLAPVEDLTSLQQENLPQVIDQKISAVESGANQQELKNSIEIQRNEDLDISSAQRFLQRERDEIASQLGEQGLRVTPSAVEKELSNRLGASAYTYGPKYTARKQALELYAQTGAPVLTEKIQRFGLSPVTFETFENMPAAKQAGFEASPTFSTSYYPSEELIPIGLTSNINIDVPTKGQVSLASLRKPVITEDTARAAEEYYQTKKEKALDWLGNLRVQLEPKRNQIFKERRALVEQSAQEIIPRLEAARQAGQTNLVEELELNLENLRAMYRNPQLGTHRADELNLLNAQLEGAQSTISQSIAGIQKKYPTTISDWSGESSRIFGEVDVDTGELIPETIEVRSGRPTKITTPKGGGGRNIAEYSAGEGLVEEIRAIQGGGRIRDYDETGAAYSPWRGDNTQTGRDIDIYGIRPSSEKRADPTKQPSQPQYTKQEIADESMRLSQADPYGDVPIAPGYQQAIESLGSQEATPERRASVLLSEQVRKGQIQMPKQSFGPYPSTVLTGKPMASRVVEPGLPQQTVQLSLPSDVVPEAGRTGIKRTSADIAADQLEQYMSKLQRGRYTPLTSAVRIQPTLF